MSGGGGGGGGGSGGLFGGGWVGFCSIVQLNTELPSFNAAAAGCSANRPCVAFARVRANLNYRD